MAKRTALQIIAGLVLILLVYSCANQLPPAGGEVDRIPPEILEIYPPDRTINYSENSIEITFSEYVNKRSVQEAIFISPNISGNIQYDWSGKTLEIELPDSLLENTTYTITIGTDVEDINNKNKMENAYTFAFSTGNKIDNGTVTGNVFDKDPSGVMIYAYKVLSDKLNPAKQKPNYITQCGVNGSFKLTGLADGDYRIFAVRDNFKDFIYDSEQDSYGVPYMQVSLSSQDSIFSRMNYQLQIDDTTKPRVFGLTMTDRHHILIEFSEGVDSANITNSNFFIYDSVNRKRTDVTYFYKGKTKAKNYLIAFRDTLLQSESLYLHTENIFDNQKNKLEYEITSFVKNDEPDTTYPELLNFREQFPNKKVDYKNGFVSFEYTDGFSYSDLQNALSVIDKSENPVKYEIDKIDDASFYLRFGELKSNAEYQIQIDQNLLADVAGNKIDSNYTYKFSTINNLDFSGISGKVIADNNLNIVVNAKNIADNKLNYYTNNSEFNFERVFPGKYFLIVFDDANNNGKYDKGSIIPFKESEKFIFYPDTLELKPRWPVGDIEIRFD